MGHIIRPRAAPGKVCRAGGGGGGCEGAGWLSPVKKVIAPPGRRYSRHQHRTQPQSVTCPCVSAGEARLQEDGLRRLQERGHQDQLRHHRGGRQQQYYQEQSCDSDKRYLFLKQLTINIYPVWKKVKRVEVYSVLSTRHIPSKKMLSIPPYDDRKTNWLKLNIKTYTEREVKVFPNISIFTEEDTKEALFK